MNTNEKRKLMSQEERQKLINEIEGVNCEIDDIECYITQNYIENIPDEEQIDPLEEYYASPEGQLQMLFEERQELEEKLFEDNYWRKNVEYTEAYKERIEEYSGGNVISDIECDISKDVFNRKKLARTIAETLSKPECKGPFNIGILGKWGQGKTVFLEHIKKSIIEKDVESRIHIIEYNASEYDEREKIWANLANCLFEEYERKTWFAKIRFYISKVKSDIRVYAEKVILNIFIIVILFGLTIFSKGLFSIKNIFGYFAGTSVGLSAAIIAVSKMVIPFLKTAISSSIPLSDKIVGKMKLPSYVEVLGTRAEIALDLNVLFDAWLKKEADKVVIFVDELDRCTEKGIVEFFQSIQLLVSNKKLCFVFAIDERCLEKAFMKCNGISNEEVKPYLKQFLDKYVSVIIPLEDINDYSKFIRDIVGRVKPNEERFCFTEDEVQTLIKCINTVPKKFLTPRKVKKIINILILLKEYCVRNINREYAIKFEELITWYIFALIYRGEAKDILSIYQDNKKFISLRNAMSRSFTEKIEESLMCKKYVQYMQDYFMNDIILYNYISSFFMPEVS